MQVDEKEATAGNFKKLVKRGKRQDEEDEYKEDVKDMQVAQKQVIKVLDSLENKMQRLTDMLVYLESKVEMFRMSSYNPHWNTFGGLEHFLQSANQISLADKAGVCHFRTINHQDSLISANAGVAT